MKKLTLTIENDFDFDLIRILFNRLNILFSEEKTILENGICLERYEDNEIEINDVNNEYVQDFVAAAIDDNSNNDIKELDSFHKKRNVNNFNFYFSDKTTKDIYNTIQEIQKKYFESGLEKDIVPMVLNNIAEIIDKDISTISRILENATYELNGNVFFYKYLFNEHDFSTFDGRPVSRFEILHLIKEYIQNEDKSKPYTDILLETILKEKGYNIERRTVNKYRSNLLHIPCTFKRKVNSQIKDIEFKFLNY